LGFLGLSPQEDPKKLVFLPTAQLVVLPFYLILVVISRNTLQQLRNLIFVTIEWSMLGGHKVSAR
jgi:hypothetical protein